MIRCVGAGWLLHAGYESALTAWGTESSRLACTGGAGEWADFDYFMGLDPWKVGFQTRHKEVDRECWFWPRRSPEMFREVGVGVRDRHPGHDMQIVGFLSRENDHITFRLFTFFLHY